MCVPAFSDQLEILEPHSPSNLHKVTAWLNDSILFIISIIDVKYFGI